MAMLANQHTKQTPVQHSLADSTSLIAKHSRAQQNTAQQSNAEHSRLATWKWRQPAANNAYLKHGISTGLWEEHHLQVGHKLESLRWRQCTPDLLYQQ